MKKVKGLTNRLAAMVLSGLLVVGAVPGTVLASESPEDLGQTAETAAEAMGQTSETAAEDMGDILSEEVSAEGFSEDAVFQVEGAAVEYYTVTLDANGGYFENEWDDAIGEIVEQAQVVSKQVPVGGTVAAAPVITETDQDGQAVTFAGWSLEPNGESITVGDEEYAPVDSCTLYAVWEAEDPSAGDIGSDTGSQGIAGENTDQIDSAQDSGDVEAAEGSQDVQDSVEADETEETATGGDAWDNGTAEESSADENPASEADTDSEPIDEKEQAAASDQEADYADEEAEKASGESSDAAISVEETQPDLNESSREEETVREDAAITATASGTCGENLTWKLEEGTLTISGTGEMYVYGYGFEPFVGLDINTVIIESGVTSIGDKAFGRSSVTSIEIPDSVTSIGDSAFWDCSSLTSIEIPDSVTSIGDSAFWDCSSLTSITLPKGITSIGDNTFRSSSVTSIEIPDSVTSIGKSAFYECENLTGIEIPESVTSIVDDAFFKCNSLTSITIPGSLTSMGYGVFSDCVGLTSVAILNGVTSISEHAFANCKNMTSITIPESVNSIGKEAFYLCKSLTSITIPDSVTSISEGMFRECNSLENITIPNSVTSIGDFAFIECNSLTGITIPKSVTGIGPAALSGCSSLENILVEQGNQNYSSKDGVLFNYDQTVLVCYPGGGDGVYSIPDTVTSIGQYAFYRCSSLTSITIPDSVTSIGSNAFNGCLMVIYCHSGSEVHKYAKTYEIPFKILIDTASVTIPDQAYIYNGEPHEPEVTVSLNDTQQISVTDYEVTYSNNTDAGTAAVTVTGKGDYVGGTGLTFTIEKAVQPIKVSDLSLTYPNSGQITASGNKGSLTYKSSDTSVATVDSAGKVTAKGGGTAKITITAAETDNYKKTAKEIKVTVAKAAQSITAKVAAPVIFAGQTTTVSVTGAKGTVSFKSSDSTIAAVDKSTGKVTAKKGGTVKITATSAATAQYNAASKTVTIKVIPAVTASLTAANQVTGIKLTWKKVSGATGYKIYRNSTLIKTITDGSTVTYTDTKANTNMTRYIYKVVVKGPPGDSPLARTVTSYRVNRPALTSVTNSAFSVMTAKWTRVARTTGYQVKYSTSKTFASDNGTVSAYGGTTDSRRIADLKRGKTYYVKIRAYKVVGNGLYWSEWSPVRTVRISK